MGVGGPAKRGAARNELATDAVKLKSQRMFIPAAGGHMEEMMEGV